MLESWGEGPSGLTELLEAQADAFGAGFLVVSADQQLVLHNERFARQWAIPSTVLARRSMSALAEWLVATGGDPGKRLAALLLSKAPPCLGEITAASGHTFTFHAVSLARGGWLWAFHNAQELHHLAAGLRDAGNLLRLLEAHLDGIILELDTDTCIVGIWATDATYFEEPDATLQGRRLADVVGGAQGAAFESRIVQVFAEKQPMTFEYTLDLHGEQRVFSANARPMPGGEEEAPRVTVMIRDITERTRMQRQLLEADRLASAALLAAGVAHEVNNPLAYTLLNLERIHKGLRDLAKSTPTDFLDGLLDAVTMSLEGARRVQTIVQDLRRFSRSDQNDPYIPVDVHNVIDFAIDIVRHEIRERAEVVRDFGKVPLVLASETRLNQVFLNLIVNAAHAIPPGAPDKNEIRLVTKTDALGRAVIEVRDTGEGMTHSVMQRIFEPFYTTKPAGLGTGLGLAICHGIVTSFGGKVDVESERGRGSVFRLTLPSADSREAAAIGAASGR
ncbi:MAG TPA: PAS domain-containing sensor histidine kinase [Labilithrix sp.]|nr:PAS domain-containing sensor histidine kinase [Labilithrix sp.]